MTEHTPTPWTYEHAQRPTDGEYDCAVTSVIDGKKQIIAETFGRVDENVCPDSQANAAFIVKAVNNHDALVKALEEIANCSTYPISIARAALASIKETAK